MANGFGIPLDGICSLQWLIIGDQNRLNAAFISSGGKYCMAVACYTESFRCVVYQMFCLCGLR